MVEERREPRFKVGDHVRIVDEPYYDCAHGWDTNMSKYCGRDAIVIGVWESEYPGNDDYTLDVDDGYFAWCENCFVQEPEIDIEESDKGLDFLFA